ncbi:MAG TPA: pentapeptide repeat-containing protein, partial [Leptospiraceae bacterium]|nr:pentapeptide repeat-containing protein [Leptospiraceae bacterium]
MMKKTILFLMAVMSAVTSVYSYDPVDLEILKEQKSCPNCDLSGANLRGMQLQGADLTGAILSKADMFGTNLK